MTVETQPEAEVRARAVAALIQSGFTIEASDAKSVIAAVGGREFEIEVYVNDVTGWRDET